MAHRKRGWILFAAVVFFTVPGSGSHWDACAAGQQKTHQLIEPCELITQVEAEEIMGVALKEGQYRENQVVGQKMCLYEAADENAFAFLNISLTQNAFMPPKIFAAGQNAKSIFSTIKEAFPDREAVNEMGDDAFIATPGIHILKGDYYVTVGAGNINQNRDKLKIAGIKTMANLEARLK
jgi:hypothetical protein